MLYVPYTQISEDLFVGDIDSLKYVTEEQNSPLVNVCGIISITHGRERNTFPSHILEYLTINLPDEQDGDILDYFNVCLGLIGRISPLDGGAVLIQCPTGDDDAATIGGVALMYYKHKSLRDVLSDMQTVRPTILPREANMMALRKYERLCITSALYETRIIRYNIFDENIFRLRYECMNNDELTNGGNMPMISVREVSGILLRYGKVSIEKDSCMIAFWRYIRLVRLQRRAGHS